MGHLKNKTLSKEKIYSKSYLSLENWKVEAPDGHVSERQIVSPKNAVAIIAIEMIAEVPHMIFVQQYRDAIGRVTLEVPAGVIDDCSDGSCEPALSTAVRELEEEVGLIAKDMKSVLGPYFTAPGYSTGTMEIFLATAFDQGTQKTDDGEVLEVMKIPFSETKELITQGKVQDSKCILAILLAQDLYAEQ